MELKSRTTMLALSGALFIATATGWAWHNSQCQQAPLAAVEQPVSQHSGPANQLNNTVVSADIAPPACAHFPSPVYRSTSMKDAIAAAKASIRREPMQSLTQDSVTTRASQVTAAVPKPRRYAARTVSVPPPPNMRFTDPPAPSAASIYNLQQTAGNYETEANYQRQEKHRLTSEDFRLVGLIDGKAIFKLRRNVAEELQLPRSFTLGQGESFANIKLDQVTFETATIHDGNALAVKSLEPVH